MRTSGKRSSEGKKIRQLRLKAGLSQEDLAHQVGLTAHTIWRLENDPSVNPRLETLRAVAKALGVPLSEIFGK
jgi:transcriptional regulator with XRE-family HTH domain